MAAKTAIFSNRRVNALLFGFIVVTLITDLGALVLDSEQAVVTLMIALLDTVAGGALFISQTAMHKGSGYLTAVTLVARLPAYRINSAFGFSGRDW
jgi:hypothetical protein